MDAERALDQFDEIEAFVAVAEEASFAGAARRLRVSAPTITRAISALEARIGSALFSRTTRSVRLTDVGSRCLEDYRRVLRRLAYAEAQAADAHGDPHGALTITAPVLFGQMYVAPLLATFLDQQPSLSVRAVFLDRVMNLTEEGVDVAVRIGELPDSSMVAKRVGAVRRVVCGAPSLLEARGVPVRPQDILRYRIIAAASVTQVAEWRFMDRGEPTSVRIEPTLSVTSNQAAIAAAETGFGLTRVLSYQIADAVKNGRLTAVLTDYELPPLPIHLIYAQGRRAPAKVRVFVEYFTHALRADRSLKAA